jgi:hypothetical protein
MESDRSTEDMLHSKPKAITAFTTEVPETLAPLTDAVVGRFAEETMLSKCH